MIIIWLFLILFIISSSNSQNVIPVKASNLYGLLNKEYPNNLIMINYYTTWCAYCKTLSNILNEVAIELTKQNIPVKIASIDVSLTENESILTIENIIGFPTMIIYLNGIKLTEYHGNRTVKDIISYLKLKTLPKPMIIHTFNDLVPYISQFELGELYDKGIFSIILGVFIRYSDNGMNEEQQPLQDDSTLTSYNKEAQVYSEAANLYESALFFITDSIELIEYLHIKENSIVIFQEFHNEMYQVLLLKESITTIDFIEYLSKEALPIALPYHNDIQPVLAYLPIKTHVLIFCDHHECEDDHLAVLIDDFALKYKGKLIFIEVNPEQYQLASFFHLKSTDLPQLIIVNMTDTSNMKKYSFVDYLVNKAKLHKDATTIYREATSKDYYIMKGYDQEQLNKEIIYKYHSYDIEAFLNYYLMDNSDIKPSLISETIEQYHKLNNIISDDDDKVVNLVGQVFHEKVISDGLNYGFNSFIYFHAPWCGHCKMIEPIISELYNYFKKNDEMVKIYRIDGTKNEINISYPPSYNSNNNNNNNNNGLHIIGYPSFYYFTANKLADPIEYNGDRTLEAMKHFIQSFKYTNQITPISENSIIIVEKGHNNPNKDSMIEIQITDISKQQQHTTLTEIEEISKDISDIQESLKDTIAEIQEMLVDTMDLLLIPQEDECIDDQCTTITSSSQYEEE